MKNPIKTTQSEDLKSTEIEYKVVLNNENSKIEGWAKTIAGFANTLGGSNQRDDHAYCCRN